MDGFDGGKVLFRNFLFEPLRKLLFVSLRPVSGSLRTLAMDGWREKESGKNDKLL